MSNENLRRVEQAGTLTIAVKADGVVDLQELGWRLQWAFRLECSSSDQWVPVSATDLHLSPLALELEQPNTNDDEEPDRASAAEVASDGRAPTRSPTSSTRRASDGPAL